TGAEGQAASARDSIMAARTLASFGALALGQQRLDRRERRAHAAEAAAEKPVCLEDLTAAAEQRALRRIELDKEAARRGLKSPLDLDAATRQAIEARFGGASGGSRPASPPPRPRRVAARQRWALAPRLRRAVVD